MSMLIIWKSMLYEVGVRLLIIWKCMTMYNCELVEGGRG